MKLLVFGASGQAGSEFRRIVEGHAIEAISPSRAVLDVRDFAKLHECIAAERPSLIVNFTAWHVLEDCERNFLEALRTNAAGVREMARAAAALGARFVTVSTDYVFDGTANAPYPEDASPAPLQAYGISKLSGEMAALAAGADVIVARTCGLYGHRGSLARGGNFVEKRLAEMATRDDLEIGADLRCTPTSARAFAEAVFSLAVTAQADGGIYHLTAEGDCSWAEFTAEIARQSGAACRVVGVDRKGDYGAVRRPAYSVLDNRRAAALGVRLPHWQEDLARYLAARGKA